MKFRYICDLLEALEEVESGGKAYYAEAKSKRYYEIIQYWFHHHRALITDYNALLSCLLSGQRVDRVYSMQRTRVSSAFADCLGLGAERSKRLREIKEDDDLALILEQVVNQHGGGLGSVSVAINEVDQCLAELAGISRFSGPRVRSELPASTPHHQRDILRPVITRLSSKEMKWFVRILFKNLSPVQLKYDLVVRVVHPLLPMALKVRETFQDALLLLNDAYVRALMGNHHPKMTDLPIDTLKDILRPTVGSKVGRPRFLKARSFKNCAQLVGARKWIVEPKYDGEYCQIHVDLSKGPEWLQIFSKSGKDSTKDRSAVHAWIKDALQIDKKPAFQKRCVLEGELIVADKRNNTVLEFDKIRKHVSRSGSFLGTKQDSAQHEYEQLQIIFYDVLLVDDNATMHNPYSVRRQMLSTILPNRTGFKYRGSHGSLDLTGWRPEGIEKRLEYCFKKARSNRFEGMVLKPADGSYVSVKPSNYDGVIIKVKADYIPGLGDTADFAIVGAYTSSKHSVEPDLLSKTKWTHLILACLKNKTEVVLSNERPVLKNMGAVSRPCVSQDDMLYLSQHGRLRQLNQTSSKSAGTSFDVDLGPLQRSSVVLFQSPFIVDVLGSSFERPANTNHYMLRHARIVKIHNNDRGVPDVVSFDELQQMAREAREIPADALQEEKSVMQQVRQACKPKRPQFVEDQSPAHTATTSASPASTRSSRTPRFLVRMDSCEMQEGDRRFVSPLATKERTDDVLVARQPEAQPEHYHLDAAAVKRQKTLGKRQLNQTNEISPPKRRRLQRSKSDETTCSSQTNKVGRAFIPDVRSAGELFSTVRPTLQKAQHFPFLPRSLQNAKSNLLVEAMQSKVQDAKSMDVVWELHAPPKKMHRGSPLSDAEIILSPLIVKQEKYIEPFIDLLDAIQTDKLEFWHRDRRPLAPKDGDVVEESQYAEGSHKLLLIDSRDGKDNEESILEVMQTRLDIDETIDVWDWRLLEKIAALDQSSNEPDFTNAMLNGYIGQVEPLFLGTIRLTTQTASDAMQKMGFAKAQMKHRDLDRAYLWRETQVFEDGERLTNIFEMPCDGHLYDAWRSWLDKVGEHCVDKK